MLNTNDFTVGERVTFGRRNGEKTTGEIVKVNRKTLKVKQLETRGSKRVRPVGTIWTVPVTLCSKTSTATPAPIKVVVRTARPEATICLEARDILFQLEPEMLYCDGERSRTEARRVAARLLRRFRELERELGRKITEYGSITGHMPAVFGTRRSAKDSGWKPGDKVAFDAKGKTVTGYIKRVNVKSISVQPLGGGSRYWRVSPGVLRAA
jgi:hypothetical protein